MSSRVRQCAEKLIDNEDSRVAGFRVLDQWGGRPGGERTLEFLPEEEAKKKRPPRLA
jgi:hypothetical protein